MNAPIHGSVPLPDGIEDAYRQDPARFTGFIQGIMAAAIQSTKGPDALPEPSSTLDKVIECYRRSATIKARSVQNNVLALLRVLDLATGKRDPSQIPLSEINASLLFRAQERFVQLATAGMKEGPAKREATETALRSSKSIIRQARCIFSGIDIDFVSRYAAEGIAVAQCIGGFLKGKVRGKPRKAYKVATSEAVQRAIDQIGKMRQTDLPTFLAFWIALGCGLRRSEIRQLRWEHFVELDGGALRIKGDDLIGKNGFAINVPLQKLAADALRPFVCAMRGSGPLKVVDTNFDRRLNKFLREMGFKTRLATHELRAYIGSKVYEVNPRAAKELLRHQSMETTEKNYCRYVDRAEIPEVL